MKIIFVALIFLLVSPQTWGLNVSCETSGDIQFDPNTSPSVIQQQIESAQQARTEACTSDLQEVDVIESVLSSLRSLEKQVSQEIQAVLGGVDSRFNELLSFAKQILFDLKNLPDQPSSLNNVEFNRIKKRISDLDRQISWLEKNWNSQFLAPAIGPSHQLQTMAQDPKVPPWLRSKIQTMIDRIPGPLLGKSFPHRDKLEFLQRQLFLVQLALQQKETSYNLAEQRRTGEIVDRTIDKKEIPLSADQIHNDLLKVFGSKSSVWSAFAIASGACTSAEETLSEQLKIIQKTIELSPVALKSDLTQVLQKEINLRSDLQSRSCQPDQLDAALERWVKQLPRLCQKGPEDVQIRVRRQITQTQDFLQGEQKMLDKPKLLAIYRSFGEELWNRGFYLSQLCGKAFQ